MAIVGTFSAHPRAGSATDATSYNTASWTPVANDLCTAFVLGHRTGGPGVPTLTGNGITWSLITGADVAFQTITTQTGRLFCFRGAAASPSVGALTIDWGSNVQANCFWQIQQWAGVNQALGQGGVLQAVTARADGGATSLAATLAAFGDPVNNAVLAFVGMLGGTASVAIEGGYTSLSFTSIAGQGGSQGEYLVGEDLSPSFTGMVSAHGKAIIALELADASFGGGSVIKARRSLSMLGTRIGSRQPQEA